MKSRQDLTFCKEVYNNSSEAAWNHSVICQGIPYMAHLSATRRHTVELLAYHIAYHTMHEDMHAVGGTQSILVLG